MQNLQPVMTPALSKPKFLSLAFGCKNNPKVVYGQMLIISDNLEFKQFCVSSVFSVLSELYRTVWSEVFHA